MQSPETAKYFSVNQTRFAFRHRRFAVCSYADMPTAVLLCSEESKNKIQEPLKRYKPSYCNPVH
jgi:hypothetical protein